MRIRLNPCPHFHNDWFTIVRRDHDGREWYESTGENCSRLMLSERLSPEACIEGEGSEMVEIAEAIRNRGSVRFKRCAVEVQGDGFLFYSPRNSQHRTLIPFGDADEFAAEVLKFFEKK